MNISSEHRFYREELDRLAWKSNSLSETKLGEYDTSVAEGAENEVTGDQVRYYVSGEYGVVIKFADPYQIRQIIWFKKGIGATDFFPCRQRFSISRNPIYTNEQGSKADPQFRSEEDRRRVNTAYKPKEIIDVQVFSGSTVANYLLNGVNTSLVNVSYGNITVRAMTADEVSPVTTQNYRIRRENGLYVINFFQQRKPFYQRVLNPGVNLVDKTVRVLQSFPDITLKDLEVLPNSFILEVYNHKAHSFEDHKCFDNWIQRDMFLLKLIKRRISILRELPDIIQV